MIRGASHSSCFRLREVVIDSRLYTELWTSWASLLRSYAAAHGMNAAQHAVVEVSAGEITLRVGSRWVRFSVDSMEYDDRAPLSLSLKEDGTVQLDHGSPEEMDFAAERIAREMLTESK